MTLGVLAILLGGIGIFLTGMILLTEGLRDSAGDSLRSGLQRFARSPARALGSGAAITALVQSSSATTLTTIGFVSAGLLTFPQAVGVIFGANLGTTSTGWIVSLLGLKISVGAIALPLVGLGALVRLLGRGRVAHGGMALVGFGLIFVGIDTLQVGMEGLAESLDPGSFPGATLGGRILLVGLGLAMTVVMQSSSAAVATTLTALHAGTIGLEQAALLVVGQNLGTTVKAALAAIGGSVPVRRTAAAHILFNIFTAALGLIFLPLLLSASVALVGEGDPAVAIALFHTGFNLLGVVVFFPFITPFAGWVERLVPESRIRFTRSLDPSLAEIPSVAVEAGRRAGIEIARELFGQGADELGAGVAPSGRGRGDEESVGEALVRLRAFLTGIHTPAGERALFGRHLSTLHAADHLERYRRALAEGGEVDPELGPRVALALREWESRIDPHDSTAADPAGLEALSLEVAAQRKQRRARLLEQGVSGAVDAIAMRRIVDGLLRLDRLAYHAWRTAHHLERAAPDHQGDAWDGSPMAEGVPWEPDAASGEPNPSV